MFSVTSQTQNNLRVLPGKAEMWSDNDGISWLKFLPDSEISEEDMRRVIDLSLITIKPGEHFRVIADITEMASISDGARSYAAGKNLGHIYEALAIVAASPATRLVANFFIRFHKPPRPVKIFKTAREAKKWLLKYKAE